MGQWGRVAVIGDVGGHFVEFVEMLIALGMDPRTGRLPDDLTVVQVGDLVHRGPDSPLVDDMLSRSPDQWKQLIGNHEQLVVGPPVFAWNEDITLDAEEALQRWWDTGAMVPAAAIEQNDGQAWVATHAGVTSGFWNLIGTPSSATETATALNALSHEPDSLLWRSGCMLGSSRPAVTAGPLWASASVELLRGWCGPESPAMPFNQVHGHSCEVNPRTGAPWSGSTGRETRWDPFSRHTSTLTAAGTRIVGIDPTHGTAPVSPWKPLLLRDARVTI